MKSTTWLLPTLGVLAVPSLGAAQLPAMMVGVVGGYTTTEHVWSPDADVTGTAGLALGAFVDVQTPVNWLSAGAELAYSQRGSDVLLDVGGTPTPGGIRTDYLTFTIRVRAALALGPARFHLVAGPISDIVIRSRLDPLLTQVLDEEQLAPFGVSAGAGLGLWVTGTVFAEIEARIVEGLQSSYTGDFVSARNRSRELVARVGFLVGP
jgi:hypothetical protein